MGKQVAYWERNPQWPQTIVMLHGFRGSHKGLIDVVQHFDGYRLILPDLPGYGESEPMEVPHTLTNYALWFDAFLAAIELDAFVSWSHSYGGAIAWIQAAEGVHRPQAVVAVSPAVPYRNLANIVLGVSYWLIQWLPLRMQQWVIASRRLDRLSARLLIVSVSDRRRKMLIERGQRNLDLLDPQVVIENYFSGFATNLEAYAPRITMPTLVIGGPHDRIVPVERLEHLQSLLPDGTLVVLSDQGHLAPLERPATTATITKRFINGL